MPWLVASDLKVSYPAREVLLKDGILSMRVGAETIDKVAKFTI
jgi:hypothetical protein